MSYGGLATDLIFSGECHQRFEWLDHLERLQVGGRHPFETVVSCLRHLGYCAFLCPQLRRSWRSILVSGCASVRPSVQEPCMLGLWNFIYGFLMEKYLTQVFFLVRVVSLSGVMPLWKIRTKSDACHILWTVHARVLKFHIWIPHGKIADPYFFSCPSYLPFWIMPLWKKSTWNLVSKISQKEFEIGAWNLVSL